MMTMITMVHQNVVPPPSPIDVSRQPPQQQQHLSQSTSRDHPRHQHHHNHHHQQQQPQHQQHNASAANVRRRPRRLNCERAKLLNGVVGYGGGGSGLGCGDLEDEANWDMVPAPPITPPAAFLPNDGTESCYRRLSVLRKGMQFQLEI